MVDDDDLDDDLDAEWGSALEESGDIEPADAKADAGEGDLDAEWGAALEESGDLPSGSGEEDLDAEWGAAFEESGDAVEGGGADVSAEDEQWAEPGEGDDGAAFARGGQERILNQDEIDGLLGFRHQDSGLSEGGIRAIINSAMVSYERLPMLEIIFDRLVRLMTSSLRNFTSDNVEVSLDDISSVRFGDYLNSIPLPAILAVFKAEEWDNFGIITVESSLIYSIVDVLLGGRRGTTAMRVEGRPYTTIESALVERMVEVILDDIKAAFEPLSPVNFTLDRLETNPRFAAIARPANASIIVKLRIDMEDRGGRIELLLPYATLEPIRELLLQMFMGEKFGRDSIWESHLATELWSTEVQIDAVLDEKALSLNEVMNLEVGQTVMLNCTRASKIELRCGGIPLLHGEMGRMGDNVAIKIAQHDGAEQGQPKMLEELTVPDKELELT